MTKVCEMCGEPAYSNGDGSTEDYGYCSYCKDHTTFIDDEEDEDEKEFNDDLLRADDKIKAQKENSI